jgi:hypothetical protein
VVIVDIRIVRCGGYFLGCGTPLLVSGLTIFRNGHHQRILTLLMASMVWPVDYHPSRHGMGCFSGNGSSIYPTLILIGALIDFAETTF